MAHHDEKTMPEEGSLRTQRNPSVGAFQEMPCKDVKDHLLIQVFQLLLLFAMPKFEQGAVNAWCNQTSVPNE